MAPKTPGSDAPPPQKGGNGKIANSLVALGSAAVLTVYAAGFVRTRAAAERYSVEAADLRDAVQLDDVAPALSTAPTTENATEIASSAPAPVSSAPEIVAAAVPERTAELKRSLETNAASSPVSAPLAASTASSSDRPAPASTSPDVPAPAAGAAAPATSPAPAAAEAPAAASTTTADSSSSGSSAPTSPTPSTSSTSSTPSPAPTPAPPAPPPPPPGAPQITIGKDGRYLGWGYSRHGDIEAAIVIQDGRIVSTEITQCLTRYSCDVIAQSPGQVIERQSPFIDLVSGSTESANAYANAVYRAIKASLK